MTAIDRIEGREGDVFYFKDSNGSIVKVFSDLVARCMIYASGFHEFRVVQTGYDHVEVYLDTINANTKTSVNHEFARLAATLKFMPPIIQFKQYKRDLTKKLRRVERDFL